MNPRGRGDGKTIQVRYLAKKLSCSIDELRSILRQAGIDKALDGTPLYGDSKVDIEKAMEAFRAARAEAPPAVEAPVPPPAPMPAGDPAASLRAEAAGAPAPLPGPRSVSFEDNPVDTEAALAIEEVTADGAFPPVPGLPPDLIHKWVNNSSARISQFVDNHWRAPTSRKTLLTWDPSGRLATLQGPDGLVIFKDTVLMVKPRRVYEAEQAARQSRRSDRAQEVLDTFMANIEEAQRTLRDVLHLAEPERHISVIRESHEDSVARQRAARTRARSGDVVKPRVFVGRAAGR